MRGKKAFFCLIVACLMLTAAACSGISSEASASSPEPTLPGDVLEAYIAAADARDYEKMYSMISENSNISKEDFVTRNKNIYEGIKAENLKIAIEGDRQGDVLSFQTTMDTLAGRISFVNQAVFQQFEGVYKLEWNSSLIFPNLDDTDKVRVTVIKGERGSILDRNGRLLAGKDNVYSIGFVPGKINAETREEDIAKVAELLDMSVESINSKLSENWVKDDLYVPLKNISYTDTEKKEKLLEIKGIGFSTVQDRVYPLGEKAAHLTGYIHSISQEELDTHAGQGYSADSMIGKVGMESLLEGRIRGIDGCRIYIVDQDGREKETLAERAARNGENITLTVDAELQEKLYDQMKDDKGSAVVMNPKTGEILALVSTPSYDPNAFILGLTEEKWAEYNNEETQPMYNRFRAAFVPGSTLKPITAALALSAGSLTAEEDFGPSGLSWQKDSSWGNYSVTTVKQYDGAANVQNALIYSDNIYFAKTAMKMGGAVFAEGLRSVGFGEEVPFEFGLSQSKFGTDMAFDNDIDLADSGFGQGKILINPIHMASIYTAFLNQGNMMAPYLEKETSPKVWKENVFSGQAIQTVQDALIQVIEDPNGTGHSFRVEGLKVAGKTGTAEIKDSKQDTQGTELGWFVAYSADESQDTPYLAVAMVEDVKDRGGSHYVIPIVRSIFAE